MHGGVRGRNFLLRGNSPTRLIEHMAEENRKLVEFCKEIDGFFYMACIHFNEETKEDMKTKIKDCWQIDVPIQENKSLKD